MPWTWQQQSPGVNLEVIPITGQHYWTALLDMTRGKVSMKISITGCDFRGETYHWTAPLDRTRGKVIVIFSITRRDFGGETYNWTALLDRTTGQDSRESFHTGIYHWARLWRLESRAVLGVGGRGLGPGLGLRLQLGLRLGLRLRLGLWLGLEGQGKGDG